MVRNKYITIQELLGELKDHPMLEDLTLERVISYSMSFCRKWGANVLFDEKSITVKADNYRVLLPCDFYELIAVRDHESQISYRASTDVFHYTPDEVYITKTTLVNHETLTYKINGNILFLSTKDNEVDIVYQAKRGGEPLPLYIESRRRHIPHADGVGTWDHTTYFVIQNGTELVEKQTLRDAKEYAEGLL